VSKGEKINGDDILNRILTLSIEENREDPKYMKKYMRLKRKKEKIPLIILRDLEEEAIELYYKLNKILGI